VKGWAVTYCISDRWMAPENVCQFNTTPICKRLSWWFWKGITTGRICRRMAKGLISEAERKEIYKNIEQK